MGSTIITFHLPRNDTMTNRDLQQIKTIVKQVIREEKVLETHRWYALRDYCKLVNRTRDDVWRKMEANNKNWSIKIHS